jgi:hypothetical protein
VVLVFCVAAGVEDPTPMAAEAPATMTAEARTAVRADLYLLLENLRDALIRDTRSCGGGKPYGKEVAHGADPESGAAMNGSV